MVEKFNDYQPEEIQKIGTFAEDLCVEAIDSLSRITPDNARELGTLLVDYTLQSIIISRNIHEFESGRDEVFDLLNARVIIYQTAINDATHGDYTEVKLIIPEIASQYVDDGGPVEKERLEKLNKMSSVIKDHDIPYVRPLPAREDPGIRNQFKRNPAHH